MAYTVYLGRFAKKLNSTAQPDYSSWSGYSCVFKEETSIYRPTLTLSATFQTLVNNNYNYAYMLGRYYWIRDIRAVRSGVIDVDMILDPLATYKSSITSTSAFIEYGFNSYNAGAQATRIPDQRQSINANPTAYTETADVSQNLLDVTAGCYIVQAVGNAPAAVSSHRGLAAFALTAAQLAQLMTAISSTMQSDIAAIIANPNALTPQDIANQLSQYSMEQELLNESAMAAIQSVRWLPLKLSGAVGTYTQLYLGNYGTGITGLMLQQNTNVLKLTDIDIPWPVTDWKRNNCQILLYLPFFGTIPIPVDQCINYDFIGVSWSAEYFSGSISVVIRAGNVYTIYTGSTNISVDMGIGRSMVGASGLVNGGLQMVGGALQMAGGVLDVGAGAVGAAFGFGGVSNALASIPNGAQNMFNGFAQTVQPVISCAGTMGGMAAIAQSILTTLQLLYYPPIDDAAFSAKYGHPVFSISTPASGFCKTRGFSVTGSMPAEWAAMINATLDGGAYIE